MKLIELNKIDKPTKIYAEYIECGAISQFISAMENDFATRGALMPDVHQGYSLPIGAVVETKGVVVPSWVGYDIGCGMCAVRTSYYLPEVRKNADLIYQAIIDRIPVGFHHRSAPIADISYDGITSAMDNIIKEKNGACQLGTLGGGNHFIEIGYGKDNTVYIIIHSGSRGVGHGCASHYMRLASPTGKASEGHYGFSIDSQEGKDYIQDMNWCLSFALHNRMLMIEQIGVALSGIIEGNIDWDSMINRNHNHAESKDGVHWIHRKGATHAEKGMRGVIPGNMRDGSFIVVGKGNEDAICSSSHGAGRVLGRKKAKEILSLDDFRETMKGVVANVSNSTLDESPFAYKNIFEVMDNQKDLVDVIDHVKPIINIKG
jgi:tRNA-splicing ligase RtcB